MLIGGPNDGKNLFAASCTRFWLADLPAMRVMGRFNGSFLTCPLAWFDEHLPTVDGFFPHEEFKHLIGAETFAVEPKGREIMSVQGYCRFLATGNKDLFAASRSATNEANAAFAERILRISFLPESAAFLRHHHASMTEFVQTSALARHVLTLPRFESAERFGLANTAATDLAIESVWGSRLCHIFTAYIVRDPRPKTGALIYEDGRLWVNASQLLAEWRGLSSMLQDIPRDLQRLYDYLAPLLVPLKRGEDARLHRNRMKYREIDMRKLTLWADRNDMTIQPAVLN
jgi:hypothetical protein